MNQANLDDRRGVDLCKCPDWRGARGLGVGSCSVVVEVENWNIVEVESVCLPSLSDPTTQRKLDVPMKPSIN